MVGMQAKTIFEPFRIKAVEPIRATTREDRLAILERAGYNLFAVEAADVLIDLLTDSGTGAMSAAQWGALMQGDESYAGSKSFYRFEQVVRDLTGLRYVLPTHQGRAAERILCSLLAGPGKTFLANSHFDTTRANIEFSGAEALDLLPPEARIPSHILPFKGNVDLVALEKAAASLGPEQVPLIILTVTNNTAGGQPVSLDNLRGKVRRPLAVHVAYLDRYGEPRDAELEGFPAVVAQHETDHLLGKLFVDRMADMTTLTHQKEWERFWVGQGVALAAD